jgi:uncharacterized protein
MNKSTDVVLLMAKAEGSLDAARVLLRGGHHDFAASRTYYAMFYAAEAALLHRDLQFSRHSAVIARFGEEFVKTGLFAPTVYKSFRKGFDLRNAGDYGLLPIPQEDAGSLLEEAAAFLSTLKSYLRNEGYDLAKA